MSDNVIQLTPPATTAPLQNVSLCTALLEKAMNRPRHLPGMVTFYGPSGYGKSFAAAHVANKHRAYYVECRSTWTRKAMLLAILKEMAIDPARTLAEMTDQVSEQLAKSKHPLIVDEMDHIVAYKAVELIRDIYEGAGAPILLIGEEQMPARLQRWERFHNRMLDWQPAQPANADDAHHLAKLYCREVEIAADLLTRIREISRGVARRICVNLNQVEQFALSRGLERVDLAVWGKREFYTGNAPTRRAV